MDTITITATMGSPLLMTGGYLTLDAILAARIYDDTQDVEIAHSTVPLRCTDGLFHASAAMAEPTMRGTAQVIASLRASHDLTPDMVMQNKEGRVHAKLGTKRRIQFGNVQTDFRFVAADTVIWQAEGDADRVRALLDRIFAIGAKRHAGWGAVTQWTVETGENDGLLGYDGEPLRPIPVDLFTGDRSLPIRDAAWRPAYWNPYNRAACYAPVELVQGGQP